MTSNIPKESVSKNQLLMVRRIIQIICFVFLPALFIQIFSSMKIVFIYLVHGKGTLEECIPSLLLLLVTSLLTIWMGRFFCGWMCAFGSLGDFLFWIVRINQKNPRRFLQKLDPILKWVKVGALFVIVVLLWGFQLDAGKKGSNPWDLFGMLVSIKNLGTIHEWIGDWGIAGVKLALIILGSILVERFFCRYLCPLGAYFSIISKIRILKIRKTKEVCGSCKLCTKKCNMGLDLDSVDVINKGDCISCMECIRHCPKKNAQLGTKKLKSSGLVLGMAACLMILATHYGSQFLQSYLLENPLNSSFGTQSLETTEPIVSGTYDLPDGEYKGVGIGFRGEVNVIVTIKDQEIENIVVESSMDDLEYMNRASSILIPQIISTKSAQVDAVTGATYSSNAIMEAVSDALGEEYVPTVTPDTAESGHGNRHGGRIE